jgi:hypothetical protein
MSSMPFTLFMSSSTPHHHHHLATLALLGVRGGILTHGRRIVLSAPPTARSGRDQRACCSWRRVPRRASAFKRCLTRWCRRCAHARGLMPCVTALLKAGWLLCCCVCVAQILENPTLLSSAAPAASRSRVSVEEPAAGAGGGGCCG